MFLLTCRLFVSFLFLQKTFDKKVLNCISCSCRLKTQSVNICGLVISKVAHKISDFLVKLIKTNYSYDVRMNIDHNFRNNLFCIKSHLKDVTIVLNIDLLLFLTKLIPRHTSRGSCQSTCPHLFWSRLFSQKKNWRFTIKLPFHNKSMRLHWNVTDYFLNPFIFVLNLKAAVGLVFVKWAILISAFYHMICVTVLKSNGKM